jgi:hypothetical protein
MLHNFYLFRATPHLVLASSVVFLILNFVENLIHYNIGRSNESNIKLKMPSVSDMLRIIVVMIVFAVLQGIFTDLFIRLT